MARDLCHLAQPIEHRNARELRAVPADRRQKILYRLDEALDAIEDGKAEGVELPASARDAIEHLALLALTAVRNGELEDPDVGQRVRQIIARAGARG